MIAAIGVTALLVKATVLVDEIDRRRESLLVDAPSGRLGDQEGQEPDRRVADRCYGWEWKGPRPATWGRLTATSSRSDRSALVPDAVLLPGAGAGLEPLCAASFLVGGNPGMRDQRLARNPALSVARSDGVQGGVELVAHARLVRVGHKQDQKPQSMLSPQDRVRLSSSRGSTETDLICQDRGVGRPQGRQGPSPLHLFRLRPHLRLLPRSLRPWAGHPKASHLPAGRSPGPAWPGRRPQSSACSATTYRYHRRSSRHHEPHGL